MMNQLRGKLICWTVDFMGVHNLSFDQNWKKYSPGKQLMEKNLRRAWEEGRTVDFLPGNLDYKEKVATRVEPVRELHLFRKSLRGVPCQAVNRVEYEGEEKNNPTIQANQGE